MPRLLTFAVRAYSLGVCGTCELKIANDVNAVGF